MANFNDLLDSIQHSDVDELDRIISEEPELLKKKTEKGLSPLLYACYFKNPELTRTIKPHFDDLDVFEAAATGDLEALESAISGDPSAIDTYSPDGYTPLGYAAYFGNTDAVEFLLKSGADVNASSHNDFHLTPLHSACSSGYNSIASLLLESGADPNAQQSSGVTPLHSAAHHGNKSLIKMLLVCGADSKLTMNDGKTPADLARESGHNELAFMLH